MPTVDSSDTLLLQVFTTTSFWGAGVQQIGVQCLAYHLSMAALAMTTTSRYSYIEDERLTSLMFIKGSGLATLLDEFELPYQAEDLRATFFERCKRLKSAS